MASLFDSPSISAVGALLATVKSGTYLHYLTAADFRWRRLTVCAKRRIRVFRPDSCKYMKDYGGFLDHGAETMAPDSAYTSIRIAKVAERREKPSRT